MNLEKQGLRIISAEIKNFKKIAYKQIDFNGRSVIIAGKNKAGKSSLIQALQSPMDSKYIPLEPIKTGEDRAEIEIEIGGTIDGEVVRYKIATYFSPEDKKGRVVLFDQDGSKIEGGKKIIESIVGNIGFDIFDFIEKGRTSTGRVSEAGVREQIEILSSLMPMEGREKLHKLDREKDTVYKERTAVNNEITNLKEVTKLTLSPDEVDKYSKPIEEKVIEEKLSKISENVEKWNERKKKHNEFLTSKAEIPGEIESLEIKIKEIQEQIQFKKDQLEYINSELPKYESFFTKHPEKPSVESIAQELKDAREHNKIYESIEDIKKKKEVLKSKEIDSESKTQRLKDIQEEKKNVFTEYPLPVEGLEFDETNITFGGLPLNSEQISTSELITIGAKIGMAMNPTLRLMIIRDGSLLDEDSLKYCLKICEEKDYQLFIEVVDSEHSEVEVKFTESEVE